KPSGLFLLTRSLLLLRCPGGWLLLLLCDPVLRLLDSLLLLVLSALGADAVSLLAYGEEGCPIRPIPTEPCYRPERLQQVLLVSWGIHPSFEHSTFTYEAASYVFTDRV